ncbi:MAG: hypothetical protein OXM58_13630 [Rhodospirillaceae bacterium]|nr:hypothetical protein [Rhodospirillaceae bacterium]MDE0617719.1 hypothetical protein [Rhodospirillaceae bacterium]
MSSAKGKISKHDKQLLNLDQWLFHAPPKGRKAHWKDGRSAKEIARLWLEAIPHLPLTIEETLLNCAGIGRLHSWCAEPEAIVPFDKFRGPANLDMLLTCEDERGQIVIGIEAKADETFGGTIGETLSKAHARLRAKPRSKGVERIYKLATLFELNLDNRSVLELRYQLLTATAGVLAEADRQSATRALVLIHDFVSHRTETEKRVRNARDLNCFLREVFGYRGSLRPGTTTGPFDINDIQLYFGKSQTEC